MSNELKTLRLINGCWDKCDINNWNIDGTNFWPLIMTALLQQGNHSSSTIINQPKTNKTSGEIDKVAMQRSIENLAEIKDSDAIFFERIQDYTVTVDGLAFNKDIDPYYEELSSMYKSAKLQVGPLDNDHKPYHNYCLFDRSSFKREFFRNSDKQLFQDIESLIERIGQELHDKLSFSLNKDYARHCFVEFYANNHLMKYVFDHVQPKVIFLSCYSDPIQFALIYNCFLNNIKTVEIQHGSQALNPMYQGWKKIPKEGYPLLPNYFWCWNKIFVQKIMEGRGETARLHMPFEGGNLWLEQESKKNKNNCGTYSDEILEQLDSCQNIILIGLQWNSEDKSDFEGCIPTWLENEISDTPTTKWLVRLHPAQWPYKEIFKKYLKKNNIDILDFEQSTTLPLYESIKCSTHFLSAWSTTSYEAAALGKCSAIVDQKGKDTFSKFIDAGVIHFLSNHKDLEKFLHQSPPEKNLNRLLVTPEKRQNNIRQILQN